MTPAAAAIRPIERERECSGAVVLLSSSARDARVRCSVLRGRDVVDGVGAALYGSVPAEDDHRQRHDHEGNEQSAGEPVLP